MNVTFGKKNPFLQSMVRLQVPAGMSPSMNVGGFEIEADENGIVEVPKAHADTLRAHGLVDAPPLKEEKPQGNGGNGNQGGKVGSVSGNGNQGGNSAQR